MIYALNVYDIIPGREALYSEYAQKATPLIESLDMTIMAAGHSPIREVSGKSRGHFVLAQFNGIEVFEALMDLLEENNLHQLREEATENYIWTVYESWEFGE